MFDFHSKILHFVTWLLFLVSFLVCGSKCRVNKADSRITLWCTWLVNYDCLHILHPYRKKKKQNKIKEFSIILQTTLNS